MSDADLQHDEPGKRRYFALVDLTTPPLPRRVRRDAGHLLNLVQDRVLLSLPVSRPMPSIAPGVHELRLSDRWGDWRIIYRIDAETVLAIDVFKKTSEKTPAKIIRRCRARLRDFDAA